MSNGTNKFTEPKTKDEYTGCQDCRYNRHSQNRCEICKAEGFKFFKPKEGLN